jgi:hypothetical protein
VVPAVTRRLIDLTGLAFGRLVVLRRAEGRYHRIGSNAGWLCRCACGAEPVIDSASLRKGDTRSCGCLRMVLARDRAIAQPRDAAGRRFARP